MLRKASMSGSEGDHRKRTKSTGTSSAAYFTRRGRAGNGAPGHGHCSEAARRVNPGKNGCLLGISHRTHARAV